MPKSQRSTKKVNKWSNFKWSTRSALLLIVIVGLVFTFGLTKANAALLGGGGTTATEKPSWGMKTVTIADGRKYHALMPSCGVTKCKMPRQLFIFTHGVGGPEDVVQAKLRLQSSQNINPNAIFAYSISKNATKRFDAGTKYCCTYVETNEIKYLTDIVNDIASKTPVDRTQVGLFGQSNGGMLSQRAACLRPDVFRAAASWAGTWTTEYEGCQHGTVNIEQWHGDKDTVAPINGGPVNIDGHPFYLPPAAELGTKLTPESHFELHVIPGEDHVAPGWVMDEMVAWLNNAVAN